MAACDGGRNGSSNILTLQASPVTHRKGSKGSKVSALPTWIPKLHLRLHLCICKRTVRHCAENYSVF